jgi:hypothetical protein
MCSIDEPALRRVAEAIDQLEADRGSGDAASLAARVAAVWSMVSEIDPELARLVSRYGNPADGAPTRSSDYPDPCGGPAVSLQRPLSE